MTESITSHPQAVLLWSDRQVATAIGMNVKRVQELARSGALPAFKIGKIWRFNPDAIHHWIHEQSSTQAPSIGVKTQ